MSEPPPRFPLLDKIVSADGATFTLRALRGPSSGSPTVLLLPAMGASARFYAPFARALHASGLTVVTTDLRGQGESAPKARRGVRAGYHAMIQHDLDAITTATKKHFPHAPLVLLGHSLGGQLALLYAAHHRPQLSGIVLVAAGSSWFRCWQGRAALQRLLFSRWVALTAVLLGHWPGGRLRFAGSQSMGTMLDWAREARHGRYRLGGSEVDYEQALRELGIPVLAVDVDGDHLTPRPCLDHLCAKLTATTVTRMRHTRDNVGGRTLDHFRWVRHHRGLVEQVRSWIEEVVLTGSAELTRQRAGP